VAGDAQQQPVDHPRARPAAHDARHVEERHDAARTAALVAVRDVPHPGVVGVDPLPDQPQPQQAAVEVEICRDVAGDRRDVMQAIELHQPRHN
jgi:hypothetical protein